MSSISSSSRNKLTLHYSGFNGNRQEQGIIQSSEAPVSKHCHSLWDFTRHNRHTISFIFVPFVPQGLSWWHLYLTNGGLKRGTSQKKGQENGSHIGQGTLAAWKMGCWHKFHSLTQLREPETMGQYGEGYTVTRCVDSWKVVTPWARDVPYNPVQRYSAYGYVTPWKHIL